MLLQDYITSQQVQHQQTIQTPQSSAYEQSLSVLIEFVEEDKVLMDNSEELQQYKDLRLEHLLRIMLEILISLPPQMSVRVPYSLDTKKNQS